MIKSRADEWKKVAERLGGESGEIIAEAIAELYAVYDSRMVVWLASLYDDGIGAFYYSAPARDTDGYLPDIESTYGVLAGIESMGMVDAYGKNFVPAMPEWLCKKVGDFILSCQDEDGYFYQKQWGKDVSLLRKSRDLGCCTYLLGKLGLTPKYPVPTIEAKKDGDGKYDMNGAPERFKSADAFRAYLEAQDLSKTSYHTGSELLSQFKEIEAYSKILGVDLVTEIICWLNKYKRSDNGLWQEKIDYHAINGLHKLSWVYNLAGAEIPDIDACLASTVEIIMSDVPTNYVVEVYNPWHVLGELVKNTKAHSASEYERVLGKIKSLAPDMIRKSIEKIIRFKQEDGSVAYSVNGGDYTSQGSPASPRDKKGASVNGAMCGSISLTSSVFKALDIDDARVPLYTADDLKTFVGVLEEIHAKSEK